VPGDEFKALQNSLNALNMMAQDAAYAAAKRKAIKDLEKVKQQGMPTKGLPCPKCGLKK